MEEVFALLDVQYCKYQESSKFILLDFITKFINKTKERLACVF